MPFVTWSLSHCAFRSCEQAGRRELWGRMMSPAAPSLLTMLEQFHKTWMVSQELRRTTSLALRERKLLGTWGMEMGVGCFVYRDCVGVCFL